MGTRNVEQERWTPQQELEQERYRKAASPSIGSYAQLNDRFHLWLTGPKPPFSQRDTTYSTLGQKSTQNMGVRTRVSGRALDIEKWQLPLADGERASSMRKKRSACFPSERAKPRAKPGAEKREKRVMGTFRASFPLPYPAGGGIPAGEESTAVWTERR